MENEKEKEKNILRNLSYISYINKNKKEIEILLSKLMKNIKTNHTEKEIKYNSKIIILMVFQYHKILSLKIYLQKVSKFFGKLIILK